MNDKMKELIDSIAAYNEGAEWSEDRLILYNEGGYCLTGLHKDDLLEMARLISEGGLEE